jgi:hypothetical protein
LKRESKFKNVLVYGKVSFLEFSKKNKKIKIILQKTTILAKLNIFSIYYIKKQKALNTTLDLKQ